MGLPQMFVVVVLVAIAFVIVPYLVSLLWKALMPKLFPKLVEEGFVADEISWVTAFFLTLLLGLLAT